MAIPVIPKKFFKHRGMNDLSDLKRIEDDHLNQLINFKYVPAAEKSVHIEMREGTSKDTMSTNLSGGGAVTGLYVADYTGGEETIFTTGDRLYELDDPPTLSISGVSPTTHDFTMLEDRVLIANGVDALREKAKGSAPVLVSGSPPVCGYLHTWHNFAFTAKISGALNRLQWSKISDKDTWPAANIQDRSYGPITGIASLRSDFFIFFLNKTEVLKGFTTGTMTFDDFSDTGCISNFGIVSNGSSLFFPARDGFYAIGQLGATDQTVGGTSLIKLGNEKITSFLATLDLTTRDIIRGGDDRENHRIVWSVRRQGQSVNDREIFFDYDSNVLGFGLNTGRYPNYYAKGTNATSGRYQLKYGDARTGSNGGIIYAYDPNASTDDGETITGTAITKAYDFGAPEILKKFINVNVLAKGTANETPVDIFYGVGDYPNFSKQKQFTTPSLPLIGTAKVGETVLEDDTFSNYSTAIRKLGKALVLKFVSNTNGKKIKIAGWEINIQAFRKKIKTLI